MSFLDKKIIFRQKMSFLNIFWRIFLDTKTIPKVHAGVQKRQKATVTRSSTILAKSVKSLKPTGLWPQDALYFKTFPKDDAYTLLHQILIERGWKFAGEPYKGNDPAALSKVIKKKQPRYVDKHCLFFAKKNIFRREIMYVQKY